MFDKLEFIEGICYFLVPNKKVTKEIGTGGGFLQSRPLLRTSPPKQVRPEVLYRKGENVPIFAHPTSKVSFPAENRNIFCRNGLQVKPLYILVSA